MCAKKSMPNIKRAINSLEKQSFKSYELIVCYDNSVDDGTEKFLLKNKKKINILFKLNNKGIYESINRCIKKSRGNIIGLLHSDDFFFDKKVLTKINLFFKKSKVDISYSNINYVSKQNPKKVIRKWIAGSFSSRSLNYGWMPPHTSVFLKKNIARKNLYNTNYKISSDYDWILRIIKKNYNIKYLDITTTNMRLGGISNKNLNLIFKKMCEDYEIIKKNKLSFGIFTLIFKNLRKIIQFF